MNSSLFFFKITLESYLTTYFDEINTILEQKYYDSILVEQTEIKHFIEKRSEPKIKIDVSDLILKESDEKKEDNSDVFNSGQFEIISKWTSDVITKLVKLRSENSYVEWLKKRKAAEIFEMCFPLYVKQNSIQLLVKNQAKFQYCLMESENSKSKIIQYTLFSEEGWKFKDIEVLSVCFSTNDGYYYNAKHKLNGRLCTLKIIHKSVYTTPRELKSIEHELNIGKKFKQAKPSTILRPLLCEAFEGEFHSTYFMLFEPLCCSLHQIVSALAANDGSFSESELKEILSGVCQSVITLHEQEMNLRDLVDQDIFITQDKRIVLGNYRNMIPKADKSHPQLFYMAPEVLKPENSYDSKKVDSWLIGTLIARLFIYDLAIERSTSSKAFLESIFDPRWRKTHSEMLTIIERFLEKNPDQRDTIQIIYSNNKNKFKKNGVFDFDFKLERVILLQYEGLAIYHTSIYEFNQAASYIRKLHYITEDQRYLFNLANCYIFQSNYEDSHRLCCKGLTYQKQGFDNMTFWYILLIINYSEFLLLKQNRNELISFFQEIVRKAEVLGIPPRPWTTFIHHFFSKLLSLNKQEPKALDICSRLLPSVTKIFSEDHILTAIIHLQIGKYNLELEQYAKALENLDQAIQIITAFGTTTYPLVRAKCLKTVADVYSKKNELNKAITFYSQVYSIYEANFGQYSPQGAEIYEEFAKIYYNAKDYINALNYFAGALDISRKIYGESSAESCQVLIKIAEVKFETRDYQDVLQILNKADICLNSIDQKDSTKSSLVRCKIYLLLGKTVKKTKDYKKAIEYLTQSLTIFEKSMIDDAYLIAQICDSRGQVYKSLSDNYKALEEFEKSYNYLRTVQSYNSNEKVKVLKHIGLTYQVLGNYEKAIEYLLKAIEMRKMIISKESDKLIASCYQNLGLISQKDSKLEKAKDYLEKALKIEKEVHGDSHYNVAIIMASLGKTIGLLGSPKNGINMLDDAFDLLKKLGKSETFQGLTCLFDKGTLYENFGDKKRAKDIFSQCLTLAKKISDKDSSINNIILDLEAKLENSFPF